MLKIRNALILIGLLLSSVASADVDMSIGIGFPNVNIGINVPAYPELVVVPGYPVYYAPRMEANYFFYDGLYWVYQNDNWYESSWYNGPWWLVDPDDVPDFLLRIPVRYYRLPPVYFFSWQFNAPPRWGDRWGRDWDEHRRGWNRWNRNAAPAAAALPSYQRQYSGERYPQELDQQREIHQQHYRYQPHDPVVRKQYQEQSAPRAPDQQEKHFQERQDQEKQWQERPGAPQNREYRQQDNQRSDLPQQSPPSRQDRSQSPRSQSKQNDAVDSSRATAQPQRRHEDQAPRPQPDQRTFQREQQAPMPQERKERQQSNDNAPKQKQVHNRDRGHDD